MSTTIGHDLGECGADVAGCSRCIELQRLLETNRATDTERFILENRRNLARGLGAYVVRDEGFREHVRIAA